MNLKIDSRKAYLIKKYAKGMVLNVGCGNLKLKNAVNVDINKDYKPDVLADFHNLPFRDNSFDSVIAFDVIEHTSHPEILIKELIRVAKSSGVIVVECLDFDVCPENWVSDPTHKYFINISVLRRLLEPFGFRVFPLYGGMIVGVRGGGAILDRYLCMVYALKRKILGGDGVC